MSTPEQDDDEFFQQHAAFEAAWDAVEQAEDALNRAWRRRAWWKKAAVCWWRHGTRHVAPGTYVTRTCWACAPRHG